MSKISALIKTIGRPTLQRAIDSAEREGMRPIVVSDGFPLYDEETGEWTGTHLMWKGRYSNSYPEKSWFTYKFWLNGSGPVGITYTFENGDVVEDSATEFIFFKLRYTDNGWETTLQTYK